MNQDYNLITSVLGFDLDATVTYVDNIGDEKELSKGYTTIPYTGVDKPVIGKIIPICYKKVFTNFNQDLLNKIRDYKSKNT